MEWNRSKKASRQEYLAVVEDPYAPSTVEVVDSTLSSSFTYLLRSATQSIIMTRLIPLRFSCFRSSSSKLPSRFARVTTPLYEIRL